ncbi:MAG: hypothetical protein QG589_361 [Patescibacteria group bacterium]|nr:hypothetical protein [Patescibacteria group bacterium]
MHKIYWSLSVILLFSSPLEAKKKQKTDPEVERLEQSLKSGQKAKTSADIVSADDPGLTPREREIKLRAREIELREELKKIEEAKKANRSPAEKIAEKEISRQEKYVEKSRRESAKILGNANVTGCEDGVAIESRATGSFSFQSHVKVRVTNTHSRPVDIEDENGPVVRNLCAGGSVTLFRARNMWVDGNYLQFHYVAKGVFPDGSMGLQESQWFSLSAYDVSSGRVQQYYTWQVTLQKVYRAQ